jgi:glycosyltransferase involved in cell wall biosynthesis
MRFHALLPVRDEADIIGQSLTHLLTWVDAVYVFDTGSVDNSWEIVQDFAGRDRRVIPLRKDPVFFSETRLRGWMFNEVRASMRDGDWFLRVDADEFHHVAPPEFVRTHMRSFETIAYHQYYDFKLTASEVKAWDAGLETVADRSRPIEERRRWFVPSIYSEPRLCKYRSTMRWPPTISFPYNAGFVARARIPIRHYPHRDPVQLDRRCRLRAIMMADEENRSNWSQPDLHHWAQKEWRMFVTVDNDPGIRHWQSGTALPQLGFTNHLAKVPVRLTQFLAHQTVVPMLDTRRPAWPADAYPQRISPQHIQLLDNELGRKT